MRETDKAQEQTKPSSSKTTDTRFLYGLRERKKQPDLEKGSSANLGNSAEIQSSPYEQHRATIKQEFKATLTSHEDGEARLDRSSDQIEQIGADAKKVVDWLNKEVLSVTSTDRASKIEKKVVFALGQRPATKKLLNEGMQLQSQWDNGYVTHKWWYGSQLSRIKYDVAIALKEERTRFARLSGETNQNSSTKKEIATLAHRIERSNVLKEGITGVRESALKEAKEYMELYSAKGSEGVEQLGPELKDLGLRIHLDRIRTEATQQINALKQEHRDNLLKEEITGEQQHTTFGVNLGNVFHSAETVLALGSVFVSGWALRYAIEAASSANAFNAANSTSLHQ